MTDNYKAPAWMICEDIFNRLKTELITEAMDALQEAINAKVIEIKGSLITLPDKPSDTEMNMFVINRLLQEKEKIIEMYGNYKIDDQDASADKIKQKERLEKFLLYVEKISMLMEYSNVLELWMNDINKEITEKNESIIIKMTMEKVDSRSKILNYIMKSKTIEKEEVISKEEREMLASILKN